MSQGLDGMSLLVTGAGSGIGRATTIALTALGARVLATDINERTAAETCETAGPAAAAFRVDITDENSVAAGVAEVVRRFGRLDGALNNAAVIPPLAPLAEVELADWRRALEVNLTGPFLCMKHEIRQMLSQGGGGVIVNLASAASLIAYPGRPGYVASKHGLAGLTKAAAVEYGRAGIRVNAICPGLVKTPMAGELLAGNEEYEAQLVAMFPLGRAGTPEEIADIATWLLSPASRYMTGALVAADAGYTAQ